MTVENLKHHGDTEQLSSTQRVFFSNFLLVNILVDFDKVPGGSISMPFSHMPNDLRTALKLNDNFGELELDGRGLVCLK